MLKNTNFCGRTYCVALLYYAIINLFNLANVNGAYQVKKECHPDHEKLHGTTIENFELISDDSKYGVRENAFVNTSDKISDFKEAKKYCEDMGMQLADIKSLDDYKSINEYMLKKYPDCQKYQHVWLIGSSQKPGDTWWWDSDLESTKFQMFLAFEPFKGKIPVDPKWDRDYVVLMCVTKDDDMQGPTYGHAYRDTPHGWRYNLGIICQFHADTECYTNSRETQQNEKHEDKLWKLGETKKRKYWAGSGQKRFEDAEIHCKEGEEHPMHLLDLEITEPEEAKELYKLMSEFIKKHDVLSSATSFFLSGSFTKMFQGDESVPFQWEWIDSRRECNVDNFYFNYFKTQHSKQGKCMSIGALYNDKEVFTISAAFCNLIHWYICFEEEGVTGEAQKGRSFGKRIGSSKSSVRSEQRFPPPNKFGSHKGSTRYLANSEDEYHNPIRQENGIESGESESNSESVENEPRFNGKPRPLKRPHQRSVSEKH